MKRALFYILIFWSFSACSGGGNNGANLSVVVPPNAFTITDSSQFIGGPLAHGRVGDMLLENNRIKVVIQKPTKYPSVCPFGGVIIDADIVRSGGDSGQDNFGKMCPLVNVEWTVNYHSFEVLSDGSDGGAKKLRAHGNIDVLDYLDLDFIVPVAKALTGQTMYFSPRYDDANDPFTTYGDLANLNIEVVTDYTLEPDANYLKIENTFTNNGNESVIFPVGEFVNGSGQLQLLIPGQGFTPPPTAQITGDTPAIIYVPFEGVDVSYGYFYDVHQFATTETTAVATQTTMAGGEVPVSRLKSGSLTYSGVTGVMLGEDFLKVLPLGGPGGLDVNFSVAPHSNRTVTEYFVVGDGRVASMFDAGLTVQGVPTRRISGRVVDETGNGIEGATVVVQDNNDMTVIVYKTKGNGNFSGLLSTGADDFARAFGNGHYKIFVEKSGFHKEGSGYAGICTPESVDVTAVDVTNISCVLGGSAVIRLSGGVTDASTNQRIPARLTIVGFDPSPNTSAGAEYATTQGAGKFEDSWIFERPWGVMDVKYININGAFDLGVENSFRLEPGRYALVFSHGVEYSIDVREINITSSSTTDIDSIRLQRVVTTPGFLSADFHLHAIPSPDSGIPLEKRALASVAEGMDVLQSSDHDWVTDYEPVVRNLEGLGVISSDSVATIAGDEISPNHYGHMHVFPLVRDESMIHGGAIDWTYSPSDSNNPRPDFVMSPRDIIDYFRTGPGAAGGEKVLQVNHLSDQATSLPIVSSWVTTTAYATSHDVTPLSSYIEPAAQRLQPDVSTPSIPLPYGSDDLVVSDFTACELSIGPELYTNKLRETGLPQWFNFLNLGILATGTSDSDSHRETVDQIGMPRNYIASDVDPRDGSGSFSELDHDSYAHAINQHKVVVSAGPFISVTARGENNVTAGIGDTISSRQVTFHVEVKSPSWAWFDTIEIYANTEPIPADDDGLSTMRGVASDPRSFFEAYHVPKFYYEPTDIFTTADGSLPSFRNENGLISASIDIPMRFDEDTWFVIFVSGTPGVEGWRSLFPIVTKALGSPSRAPEVEDVWNLESLAHNPAMQASAWGFTNPIFVDTDGDTNGDGILFEAKYIRNGLSPLR